MARCKIVNKSNTILLNNEVYFGMCVIFFCKLEERLLGKQEYCLYPLQHSVCSI